MGEKNKSIDYNLNKNNRIKSSLKKEPSSSKSVRQDPGKNKIVYIFTDSFIDLKNSTKNKILELKFELSNKNIDDYSVEDAKLILKHLNNDYGNVQDANIFSKFWTKVTGNNSIDEVKTKYEVNIFQEKLINKILGNEKGYNNEYILAFSKEKGNHLIKISEYKDKINNNQNLGGESTAAYLLYLNEKFPNKNDFLKNVRIIFGKRFKKIGPFLKEGESIRKINALNILEKYGVLKDGNFILDFIFSLLKKFKSIIASTDYFYNYINNSINNTDPDEIKEFINFLKDNGEELRKNLKNDLLRKFKNKENKEEIVEQLLTEILNAIENEKIFKVLSILSDTFESENINIQNEELLSFTQQVNDIGLNENRISFLRAQQNGDKKQMLKAKSLQIKKDTNSIILKEVSENQITEIIKRTKAGESFDDIVIDLRKDNKNLDVALLSHEKKLNAEEKINIQTKHNDFIPTEKDFKEINGETIITTQDNIIIPISTKEKNLIMGNKEKTNNLINFYTTLKKIKLNGLWQYREQISNAIGNNLGSSINYNDDLLGENEIKIFINFILNSVGKKEIKINNSLNEFIELYNNENGYFGFKNNIKIKGSSEIEEIFIKKYLPNGIFLAKTFQTEIQKKN